MSEVTLDPNVLLQCLEPSVRARFAQRLQHVRLQRGEVLHHPGQRAEMVYFPLHGLVAVLSETLDGESVQTGMIGCDGAVGAFEAFLGGQYFSKGLVQVPGDALRLSATSYRELFNASQAFRSAAERYFETLLIEARQSVVCNALHPVDSRLSRSILDVLDHSCIEGSLPLTQDALAQMLGAQRTTIAVAMSKLQRAGVVKSGRGAIEIRNKAALERRACSCRRTLALARGDIQGDHEPRRLHAEEVTRTSAYGD